MGDDLAWGDDLFRDTGPGYVRTKKRRKTEKAEIKFWASPRTVLQPVLDQRSAYLPNSLRSTTGTTGTP